MENRSGWCLFRRSSRVRNAVTYQMGKRGLNQQKLAELVGIQKYRLSNYLGGKKQQVNQDQLIKICDFLGIDVTVEVSLRLEQ